MIIHTNLLFWAAGFAPSPGLVFIHPAHRGDAGLLAHERVHQAQMRAHGWWCFVWRYLQSRNWRLRYEAEAYAVSVAHGMSLQTAAHCLWHGYWLRMTKEDCTLALAQQCASKPLQTLPNGETAPQLV